MSIIYIKNLKLIIDDYNLDKYSYIFVKKWD